MDENLETNGSRPIEKSSPGEILLQGRLQAGLTQEQVAKELYMTVYKVTALETDDYKRLNSDTFARGYIRAYANLVKVDVVAALAAYDKLMDELAPAPVVQQHPAATENGHRGAWQFLAVIGAFFIGLWLISVWFFDNHTESQYVIAADTISSVPANKVAESVSSVAISASSAQTISSSSSAMSNTKTITAAPIAQGNSSSVKSVGQFSVSSITPTSLQSLNASSAEMQSSAASSKKTSLDELSFSFRSESWLEVSDSRGDVLATELQPAGSKLRLVGRAPFDVKLGNAPAVDVQLNGKKIDIVPLMGSNVLLLKIGN